MQLLDVSLMSPEKVLYFEKMSATQFPSTSMENLFFRLSLIGKCLLEDLPNICCHDSIALCVRVPVGNEVLFA